LPGSDVFVTEKLEKANSTSAHHCWPFIVE